jgi:hypothetical protein
MPEVLLEPSEQKTKKWRVILPDGDSVNFGAKGYDDYTTHGDPKRKERYIKRHQKREDWGDWKTAGFWSRWLTWEEPSLDAAIGKLKRKFKIKVIQA